MHTRFWICVLVTLFLYTTHSAEIEEPQNYGPQVIPTNIPKARQALGYDKYERQPVDSSRRSGRTFYPYGNNWEEFDVPPVNYNFGYHG